MKSVRRWLRKWWWVIVGAAGAIFAVAFAIFTSNNDGPDEPAPEPNLRDRANTEVDRIELEGEVEKARVTATAEGDNEELDRIEEVGKEDPKAAREQLSGWLNTNL